MKRMVSKGSVGSVGKPGESVWRKAGDRGAGGCVLYLSGQTRVILCDNFCFWLFLFFSSSPRCLSCPFFLSSLFFLDLCNSLHILLFIIFSSPPCTTTILSGSLQVCSPPFLPQFPVLIHFVVIAGNSHPELAQAVAER